MKPDTQPSDHVVPQIWGLRRVVHKAQILQDLKSNIKARAYKKRALTSMYLTLGASHAGVKLYSLVQKASKARSVQIDKTTNSVLKSSGAYICKDSGDIPPPPNPLRSPQGYSHNCFRRHG